MSLNLDCGTEPEGLRTKAILGTVIIGDYTLSLIDFCQLVRYVLTNEDLRPNDPRIELVAKIKFQLECVNGFNEGNKRFEFSL